MKIFVIAMISALATTFIVDGCISQSSAFSKVTVTKKGLRAVRRLGEKLGVVGKDLPDLTDSHRYIVKRVEEMQEAAGSQDLFKSNKWKRAVGLDDSRVISNPRLYDVLSTEIDDELLSAIETHDLAARLMAAKRFTNMREVRKQLHEIERHLYKIVRLFDANPHAYLEVKYIDDKLDNGYRLFELSSLSTAEEIREIASRYLLYLK